jgi:hypothetical protein
MIPFFCGFISGILLGGGIGLLAMVQVHKELNGK